MDMGDIVESFTGKTAILAAGDFPRSPAARAVLDSARRVVCCDGAAAAFIRRTRRAPDAIVGDLDSLPATIRRRFADRVVRVSEQDDNDLAKAFAFCMAKGWSDIVVLGATGGREDHTIGNIAWLADFAETAPEVAMVTDSGIFTVLRAPGGTLETEPGMQLSFFGFDMRGKITAEGVLYPVDGLELRRWHTATLNEATGETVRLSFTGAPIVAFRATQPR